MESPLSENSGNLNHLFLSQLDLAESYLAKKKKEPARLALLIVRQLWTEENPKEDKERYNRAVRALKQM